MLANDVLNGRMRETLIAELELFGTSAEGARVLRFDGVVAAVAAINDAAYGLPTPAFGAAFTRLTLPGWRAYLARQAGRFVGSVLVYESPSGDCGISGVATLPEARGTGIASSLLAAALLEAEKRGARTTTLQATSKGAPVYAKLGYRDLGAMSMWEHRVPPPA